MKYLIPAILLALSFAPLAAQADIAPDPGTHRFSTEVEFDNLGDFPGYDVYAQEYSRFSSPGLASSMAAPKAGDSSGFGSGEPFFAVKQSNQSKIIHKDDPYGEIGDTWFELPENQPYLINATVTGKGSDLSKELGAGGALPDSNPLVTDIWVYHIDTLTDTSFKAHFVSESHYDAKAKLLSGPDLGASSISTSTIAANAPALPSTVPVSSLSLMWIVIVCMGAVVLTLVVKTWKK